jgi:outer membrane protein assembly factor BamB
MKWDFPNAANYNASSTRLLFWDRFKDKMPQWVFIIPTPNPVGAGQQVTFIFFNPQVPGGVAPQSTYLYTIDITSPTGKTETLPIPGMAMSYTMAIVDGKFRGDTTGSSWTQWTPTEVGNYTVTVKLWPYTWTAFALSTDRNYYGVSILGDTYTTTLVVQEEQVVPKGWTTVPLPTEYWTRPIEAQNTEWYRVASNWFNNAHDVNNPVSSNRYQPDGVGPNSAHIMWTKQTEDGGVIGGGNFSVPGETFNAGHQYQTRFSNQIIMYGRLYYQEPIAWSGSGGRWVCVDLRTGEEVWANWTMIASPSFGYYYDWDDMNQHGIVNPGWLFSSNFGTQIHPRYGLSTSLNITNVPGGTTVIGPKGENLRYNLANAGNTTHPAWRLTQWNSSRVFISQNSGTINASTSNRYDWNISIPINFANSPSIRCIQYDDVLLGSNGSLISAPSYTGSAESSWWAISLKPSTRGQVLWGPKTITQIETEQNENLIWDNPGAAEGVFVFERTPSLTWVGYSMYTGEKLWDTKVTAYPESDYNPFGYYATSSGYHEVSFHIAYGKLFSAGYLGAVFCYDLHTGSLLWTYEAPTNMEKFEYYTLMIGTIADGKIYIGTHEHSADTPLFKGNRVRCVNVTTGQEIWTMLGWANPYTMAIADGTLIYWNNYDHQVYAVGKGPSSTTVSIQNDVATHGNKVLVKGSVMDVSAGTKQNEQAARFPNGVPAVSEASMGKWMEYVYMQKPRPTDTTGVEVVVSVLDPNNNVYEVGRATSDATGMFSCVFTPEVPGQYTVFATFAGSEGYWPSSAETSLFMEEAPQATPPPTPTPESVADMYFVPATAGIIVAIIAVGAVLIVLMLRKR